MALALTMIGMGAGVLGAITALVAGAGLLAAVAIYAAIGVATILLMALVVALRPEAEPAMPYGIAAE